MLYIYCLRWISIEWNTSCLTLYENTLFCASVFSANVAKYKVAHHPSYAGPIIWGDGKIG